MIDKWNGIESTFESNMESQWNRMNPEWMEWYNRMERFESSNGIDYPSLRIEQTGLI